MKILSKGILTTKDYHSVESFWLCTAPPSKNEDRARAQFEAYSNAFFKLWT